MRAEVKTKKTIHIELDVAETLKICDEISKCANVDVPSLRDLRTVLKYVV